MRVSAYPLADHAAGDSVLGVNASEVVKRFSVSPSQSAGFIYGLGLANNGSDATNDVDVAVGVAADVTSPYSLMELTGALTKRLDASWAEGTNQGGKMSAAALGNVTYHVWLIKNPTTGVVDAGFDVSPSSPTMPSGYTQKRRIGSIVRASNAIKLFWQNNDSFLLQAPVADYSTLTSRANALLTLANVPTGLRLEPIVTVVAGCSTSNGQHLITIGDARDSSNNNYIILGVSPFLSDSIGGNHAAGGLFTDTSARIYMAATSPANWASMSFWSGGWIDYRGRLGPDPVS